MNKRLDPNEREQTAEAFFEQGYNCTQSILMTFTDLMGEDAGPVLRAGVTLGGGMGRLREVCGAVSGMFLVLGTLYGYETAGTGKLKTELYTRVQKTAESFEKTYGTLICRELLGLPAGHDTPEATPRTAEFYQNRPCGKIIGTAAAILAEYILEHPPEEKIDKPGTESI